jgi:hypothetical protein
MPVLFALLTDVAAETPGPVAPLAPPAPANIAQPGEALLVTGLSSVLEHPKTALGALFFEKDFVCFDFFVNAIGRPAPRLQITSSGIGGALLLDLRDAAKACDESQRASETSITLNNVSLSKLRLVVPIASFADVTGGAKGKLILSRPGLPLTEFAVALRREDYPPTIKAFLWFLGVAVPALVGAAIGLAVYKFQKNIDAKSTQRETLERFRRDSSAELNAFFEGLYRTTMQLDDDQFRATMERELGQLRVLSALPQRTLRRLLRALRDGDRDEVARELADAFSNHRDAILDYKNDKHARGG